MIKFHKNNIKKMKFYKNMIIYRIKIMIIKKLKIRRVYNKIVKIKVEYDIKI